MRRNQSVTIAALIIAIVGLSIGFAAFSNTLTIRSSASVTPDESNFQVKFSKVSDADQTGSSYSIEAILSHTGEAYANGSYNAVNFTGGNGEIDSNNPLLLKDLQANFTEPGQTVSYKLYIRNTGHYTAYLTNVNFKNIAGKNLSKECIGDEVSTTLKNQACSDITVSLRIGSTDGVGGDLYTASNDNISTQTEPALNYTSLAVGASVEAYVTITYGGSTYIDGPMSVEFGDIMLQYRSVNTPTPIPDPVVQNPWLTRGLSSEYVTFDQRYVIDANQDEHCFSDVIIGSDGSFLSNTPEFTFTNSQLEAFGNGLYVDSSYFLLEKNGMYALVDFSTPGHIHTILTGSNGTFTKASIENDKNNGAQCYLTLSE